MRTREYFILISLGVLLSVFLFMTGQYLHSSDDAFRATAERTTATVIAHQDHAWRDSSNDERIDRADVYQFTTASGQVMRFTSPISSSQPRRPIGAQAQALYDARDPSSARLDDDSRKLMSAILMWSSPIGLALSAIFLWVWWRAQQSFRLARSRP